MSSGIAEAGRRWAGVAKPTPLLFQALDHGTGYLMAAAAIDGLRERLTTGRGVRATCSLARTAKFLFDVAADPAERDPLDLREVPTDERVEKTAWGRARRVSAPVAVADTPLCWSKPAVALGTHAPTWERT
jgi:hypothetical protein